MIMVLAVLKPQDAVGYHALVTGPEKDEVCFFYVYINLSLRFIMQAATMHW